MTSTLLSETVRSLRRRPRLRRAAVGAGFLAVSALASVSIFATAPNPAPETPLERAWPVSVLIAEPAMLSPKFSSYGRVESSRQSRIRTNLIAEIAQVHVREGQWVAAGDVLVELRRDELELTKRRRTAELDQERANLNSISTALTLVEQSTEHFDAMHRIAQTKLERHQGLFERRMISRSLLDEVVQQTSAASIEYQRHRRELADFPNQLSAQRARVAKAEAQLDQAKLDLDHATIRAPFAGPVISVDSSPGDYSASGAVLVEVADASSFEVRAPIPDTYRARVRRYLRTGQPVTAEVVVDGVHTALVLTRFAGNVRAGHSGSDAFFQINATDTTEGSAPLEVGRVVNLMITLPPEANLIALPVQSIYENDRIYQVHNDRLKALTVERLGDHQTHAGEYRILVRSSELEAGQSILITQLPKAISGLLVQPIGTDGG
jgi:multidrug resistance efflux pump